MLPSPTLGQLGNLLNSLRPHTAILLGQAVWLDESFVRHSNAAANATERFLRTTRSHLRVTGENGQIAEKYWQN
jgi:hypothetical protein